MLWQQRGKPQQDLWAHHNGWKLLKKSHFANQRVKYLYYSNSKCRIQLRHYLAFSNFVRETGWRMPNESCTRSSGSVRPPQKKNHLLVGSEMSFRPVHHRIILSLSLLLIVQVLCEPCRNIYSRILQRSSLLRQFHEPYLSLAVHGWWLDFWILWRYQYWIWRLLLQTFR